MDKKEFSSWWIPKKFNLGEPHLSGLAIHAAGSIDNHIIGRSEVDYSPVIRLGKIMYRSTESGVDNPSHPEWTPVKDNPTLLAFLGRLYESFNNEMPASIDEVVGITRETGLNLLKVRELEESEQRRLKSFCCELSKQLMAYQNSGPRYCVA